MMQLKRIIEQLKQILEEEGLTNVDDNMLLDCSVRIYNAQNIKYAQKQENNPLEPATEKQKYFLQSQNKTIPAGLTKLEASKMIKGIKENNE